MRERALVLIFLEIRTGNFTPLDFVTSLRTSCCVWKRKYSLYLYSSVLNISVSFFFFFFKLHFSIKSGQTLKLERSLILFFVVSMTYYCPLQDMPHQYGHIVNRCGMGKFKNGPACVDCHYLSVALNSNYLWQRFTILICNKCENVNAAFKVSLLMPL